MLSSSSSSEGGGDLVMHAWIISFPSVNHRQRTRRRKLFLTGAIWRRLLDDNNNKANNNDGMYCTPYLQHYGWVNSLAAAYMRNCGSIAHGARACPFCLGWPSFFIILCLLMWNPFFLTDCYTLRTRQWKREYAFLYLAERTITTTSLLAPPPLSAERLTGLVIQQHHEAITINSSRCARTQPTMWGLISLKLVTDFYRLRPIADRMCTYRRRTSREKRFFFLLLLLLLFSTPPPKLYRVLICCCYTLPKGNAAMASILFLLLLLGIPLTKKRAAESPLVPSKQSSVARP